MNFCQCNCGIQIKEDKRFVSGHNARVNLPKNSFQKGEKLLREIRYCMCGCGYSKRVIITSKWHFKLGHNLKIISKNSMKKRRESQSKSLKLFNKLHPNVRIEAGKKISQTKLSEEGNKRLRDALEKCKNRISNTNKKQHRKPWNYIPEELKPRIICLNCGKVRIVTPTIAETMKYCNKQCKIEYKTGRPMENWNPNSFHDKTGYGICGEYKGIRFRSSLELSFLIFALRNRMNVKAEPYSIKINNYLNTIQQKQFSHLFNKNTHYTPDYLIDNKQLIEIKPEIFVYNGIDNYEDSESLIMKIIVGDNYCKKHNLKFGLLTDKALEGYILKDKDIKLISKEDIRFFKLKHKIKYNNYS